ncbi:MAG: LysM domain-containing protein [Actinomycetota bacterium]|nr:LysM domain-containing protein [Actinomycetota bacterium]
MSAPSRYSTVGTATWTAPDGTVITYLLRRFLPQAGQLATRGTHLVRPGERVDLVANAELGDPELSWLLADANPVDRPSDLNQPGLTIIIPLPAGAPAPPRAQ